MKKHIFRLSAMLLILVLSSSLWISQAAALGQNAPTLDYIENGEQSGAVTFTFEQLGEENIPMRAPLDGYEVDFALPYRWVVQEGEQTYLELSYNLTLLQDDSYLTDAEVLDLLSHLEVYLDDVLIYGFTPGPGLGQVVRIPIPVNILNDSNSNFHTLRMFYFRDHDCEVFISSVLEISSASNFGLAYDVVSPELSLLQFPRPLVQDSFFSEQIYMVIPDEYTESDLTAAAVIAAAVGDMGRDSVEINTLYASEATPEMLTNRNVIAVGQPDSNAFIAQAYAQQALSTGLDAQGTLIDADGSPVAEEDGVLQIFTPAGMVDTVYLMVTGSSAEAVEKAAYAIASADPQYGLVGDSAIIDEVFSNVLPEAAEETGAIMFFDDLGFHDTEFIGIGTRTSTFTFYVPHNWEITETPTVTISFIYSAAISEPSSIINLELNGNLVGSVPMNSGSFGESEVTVQLRPEDFLPGEKNRLRLTPILDTDLSCERYDSSLTWLRIHGDSYLNIPHEMITDESELMAFTNPFFYLLSSPAANQILFHLPAGASKAELDGFIDVTRLLGQERRYNNQVFAVSFADELPEEYADYHVVSIGLPATNQVIQGVNDSIPQSFVPGENTMHQVIGNVEYILTSDFSVGIVEVIASPLNPQRGLTIVTGTTEEGLSWAMDAMSDPDLMRKLSGDLSFVSGEIIEAVVTQAATREFVKVALEEVVGETVEVEAVEVPEAEPEEEPASNATTDQQEDEKTWRDFLPVVFGSLMAAALLITVITFTRNLRGKSRGSSGLDL